MELLKTAFQQISSPKLNKVYGGPAELYEPSAFEKWGDQCITALNFMWNFSLYTSPLIAGFMYRRGYLVTENYMIFTKCATTFGAIYFISLFLRGFGRAQNDTYQSFFHSLRKAQNEMTPENKKQLAKYDFDFSAWPVEFNWNGIQSVAKKKFISIDNEVSHRNIFQWLMNIPCRIVAMCAIHTFGLRIIYPGSLSILQIMLSSALLQGRAKLVEEYHGQRFKLKSRDGNEIDTMFIDQREEKTVASRILVVCCEGNAGFYEIGIMSTPINAGYSVLGWNHPGFAYSTGKPYPLQEQNAVEIVMEFAVHKLNFKLEDIIIFGWSIGGYTASWAAMNYPGIKGVILDATFDDILPLAIQHMPSWWEPIVTVAIRDHVNLHNFEQMSRYPGPVLFIRRTDDEVICTIENDMVVNRGNFMITKLMSFRYPKIFGIEQILVVSDYLNDNIANQGNMSSKYLVDSNWCSSILESYVVKHSKTYPLQVGEDLDSSSKTQLALFLVQKHMKDYRSTHCTPLPVDMFMMPWDIRVKTQ